jgi:hypothetical protein
MSPDPSLAPASLSVIEIFEAELWIEAEDGLIQHLSWSFSLATVSILFILDCLFHAIMASRPVSRSFLSLTSQPHVYSPCHDLNPRKLVSTASCIKHYSSKTTSSQFSTAAKRQEEPRKPLSRAQQEYLDRAVGLPSFAVQAD